MGTAALNLATALDLYDSATRFSGHATQWSTLLARKLERNHYRPAMAADGAAINDVLKAVSAAALGSAGVAVNAGWDTEPTISITANGVTVAGGAVAADFTLGYQNGSILAKAGLKLNLDLIARRKAVPQLSAEFTGGHFQVNVSTGTSDPVVDLFLPLAADLVFTAEKTAFATPIWAGGPQSYTCCRCEACHFLGDLATPIPAVIDIVTGLAAGLASQAALTLGDLKIAFVSESNKVGVRLSGSQAIPNDDVDLSVQFGNADFSDAGITVWVLNNGQFAPSLEVRGLGIQLGGASGGPLFNSSGFRLQNIGGDLFFSYDGSLQNLGGALDAHGLGLPLNQLGGGNDGGNAVASSLVEGVGTNSGDASPVNPAVDVLVSYVDGAFNITLGGKSPIWIGVHRLVRAVYIDQIGVEWDNASVGMLLDAGIQIGGLSIQAYELSLKALFKN